jgi:hypothetical protein
MTLECRHTKLRAASGCITMSVLSLEFPEGQSQPLVEHSLTKLAVYSIHGII